MRKFEHYSIARDITISTRNVWDYAEMEAETNDQNNVLYIGTRISLLVIWLADTKSHFAPSRELRDV